MTPPAAEPDQLAAVSKPGFSEAKPQCPGYHLRISRAQALYCSSPVPRSRRSLSCRTGTGSAGEALAQAAAKASPAEGQLPKAGPEISPQLAQQDPGPERGQPCNPSRHPTQTSKPYPGPRRRPTFIRQQGRQGFKLPPASPPGMLARITAWREGGGGGCEAAPAPPRWERGTAGEVGYRLHGLSICISAAASAFV